MAGMFTSLPIPEVPIALIPAMEPIFIDRFTEKVLRYVSDRYETEEELTDSSNAQRG